MAYKRVTAEERVLIHRWRQEGLAVREVARRLDRSASCISREIERNTGKRGYRPKQADKKAQNYAKRPGPRRFFTSVKTDVEAHIKVGWTPEMISERARLEGRPHVCKETIYKHVYADAKAGGTLWEHLPRAKRKRHRRCPRQDGRGRGRIPNQRMIETRSAEVETRKSIGHWEGDLINGAHDTGNLVTLVERNTRYTLVGRTDSKGAEEVADMICARFETLPPKVSAEPHARQRKGICPARRVCEEYRHGRVFCQSLSFLGTGYERKHERPDSPAPSQEVLFRWNRHRGTQAHRHVSERPSPQVSWLADAKGEDDSLPLLCPVNGGAE